MSEAASPSEPKDRVLVVNGQRVGGNMTESEAKDALRERKALLESQGVEANVEIKTNLCG